MAIIAVSESANLSAEYLRTNTEWPNLLRGDYLSRAADSSALFQNDVELDARLTITEGQIVSLDARLTIAEDQISDIDARVTINEDDIATNASGIATNAANIATNAAGIADINDGRYEPQFGTGSPEGIVTANKSRLYSDTSVPTLWINETEGVNTGWVQLV